jgi:hypothetical protein
MVVSPEVVRYQERLCSRGPTANYWTGIYSMDLAICLNSLHTTKNGISLRENMESKHFETDISKLILYYNYKEIIYSI